MPSELNTAAVTIPQKLSLGLLTAQMNGLLDVDYQMTVTGWIKPHHQKYCVIFHFSKEETSMERTITLFVHTLIPYCIDMNTSFLKTQAQ